MLIIMQYTCATKWLISTYPVGTLTQLKYIIKREDASKVKLNNLEQNVLFSVMYNIAS